MRRGFAGRRRKAAALRRGDHAGLQVRRLRPDGSPPEAPAQLLESRGFRLRASSPAPGNPGAGLRGRPPENRPDPRGARSSLETVPGGFPNPHPRPHPLAGPLPRRNPDPGHDPRGTERNPARDPGPFQPDGDVPHHRHFGIQRRDHRPHCVLCHPEPAEDVRVPAAALQPTETLRPLRFRSGCLLCFRRRARHVHGPGPAHDAGSAADDPHGPREGPSEHVGPCRLCDPRSLPCRPFRHLVSAFLHGRGGHPALHARNHGAPDGMEEQRGGKGRAPGSETHRKPDPLHCRLGCRDSGHPALHRVLLQPGLQHHPPGEPPPRSDPRLRRSASLHAAHPAGAGFRHPLGLPDRHHRMADAPVSGPQ
ncbi:MAG: hypothetical protein A4E67_00317 [Syntrophaceae bacterium PtaB.Bin038]|nr:MAG: hypothetical protein A4E67_00317 [Syntrophaceae bacterium PtaB.Bin038]